MTQDGGWEVVPLAQTHDTKKKEKKFAWVVTNAFKIQIRDLILPVMKTQGEKCLTCNKKKEEESAVSQTCWCEQSVCGCGSQTRIRASLPDGFEREVNPRLRASARVIDGSACPRITTQHNRDAGTHLEISLAVPLCTCGRPTRSFICAIRTGLRIRFKVCLQCRHLVSALSALASRLFGIFAPPHLPSTFTMHRPSRCQYYSSYLKAAL